MEREPLQESHHDWKWDQKHLEKPSGSKTALPVEPSVLTDGHHV